MRKSLETDRTEEYLAFLKRERDVLGRSAYTEVLDMAKNGDTNCIIIAGIPGAGKTTDIEYLSRVLNKRISERRRGRAGGLKRLTMEQFIPGVEKNYGKYVTEWQNYHWEILDEKFERKYKKTKGNLKPNEILLIETVGTSGSPVIDSSRSRGVGVLRVVASEKTDTPSVVVRKVPHPYVLEIASGSRRMIMQLDGQELFDQLKDNFNIEVLGLETASPEQRASALRQKTQRQAPSNRIRTIRDELDAMAATWISLDTDRRLPLCREFIERANKFEDLRPFYYGYSQLEQQELARIAVYTYIETQNMGLSGRAYVVYNPPFKGTKYLYLDGGPKKN